MAFPFLGIFLLFLDAHNTKMPPFVCLPKASSFIITTGSLAVSVTDMTAPVVGSSGGVYALVSAHLANVVMVSFCVCACTGYVCRWLSRHLVPVTIQSIATSSKQAVLGPSRGLLYLQMPYIPQHHHRFVLFPKIRKCVHTFMWQHVKKSHHTALLTSMSALFGLNAPSGRSSQTH